MSTYFLLIGYSHRQLGRNNQKYNQCVYRYFCFALKTEMEYEHPFCIFTSGRFSSAEHAVSVYLSVCLSVRLS